MKTTKTAKETKVNTALTSTSSMVDTSTQTPIEIALQIDEDGMTSLRNLYEFLGLSPSQFSRWCRKNIIDNPFATEKCRLLYAST